MQQSHHKLPIRNAQYGREVYSRYTYMTRGGIIPLRSYTEGIDQPMICTYYVRTYIRMYTINYSECATDEPFAG